MTPEEQEDLRMFGDHLKCHGKRCPRRGECGRFEEAPRSTPGFGQFEDCGLVAMVCEDVLEGRCPYMAPRQRKEGNDGQE